MRMRKFCGAVKCVCLIAVAALVLAGLCPCAGAASGQAAVKVPIFMYHAFTRDPAVAGKNSYYVTDQAFDKQMKQLVDNGYTPIFASELGGELPEKPIVITMDDGYIDNYDIAFPILKKYNVKATVFVIVSKADWDRKGFLSWDMLREMRDSGLVDVQSHTYDMHGNPGLKTPKGTSSETHQKALASDADRADAAFERELGYRPTVICYPCGAYDANVVDVYRERYSVGLTVMKETADTAMDRMTLPRWKGQESTVIKKSYD